MLSGWLLPVLAVAYLGLSVCIAFYGDKHALYASYPRLRPYIYGLALGVYCTSWTFFGAVGTAVRDGWAYLPIYVGPSLVFLLRCRSWSAWYRSAGRTRSALSPTSSPPVSAKAGRWPYS